MGGNQTSLHRFVKSDETRPGRAALRTAVSCQQLHEPDDILNDLTTMEDKLIRRIPHSALALIILLPLVWVCPEAGRWRTSGHPATE